MQRIDGANAATTMPTPAAAGTPGFFSEGNPVSGVPATNVTGDWLNMMQEEMMSILVAGGIAPSKAVFTQVRDAIKAFVGPGRLLKIQTFTAGGTYTPTTGTATCRVTCVGGGASGGGAAATSTGQVAVGGGGGGGGVQVGVFPVASLAGQIVTLGSGGAAASAAGNNGGTTSVGSVISAAGGVGGSVGLSATPPVVAAGGGGGGGANGNVFGGLGGYGGPGIAMAIANIFSGFGGSSGTTGGSVGQLTANAQGNSGSGPGCGGSGATSSNGGAAKASGSGAQGIVIIEEFA